jgi:Lipase (class 3)
MIMEKIANAMMQLKEHLLEGFSVATARERVVLSCSRRRCCCSTTTAMNIRCRCSTNHQHRVAVILSSVTVASLFGLLVFALVGQQGSGGGSGSGGGGELFFPSLDDTLEMARLSNLIYDFHDFEHDPDVCAQINAGNYSSSTSRKNSNNNNNNSSTTSRTDDDDNDDTNKSKDDDDDDDDDWHCHWYRHERAKQGTQVMIVSSIAKNYVAVIFAGTDDVRTSLTDADILTQPFGDVSCCDSNRTATNGTTPVTGTGGALMAANATATKSKTNWTLPSNDPDDDVGANSLKNLVKIHAGFDNAVFCQDDLFAQLLQVFDSVYQEKLLEQQHSRQWRWWRRHDGRSVLQPPLRLFATGHSLGAAASVLTAVALTDHYHTTTNKSSSSSLDDSSSSAKNANFFMHVINFGCPQIGNTAWRDYVNDYSHILKQHLSIWRIVLGWDLVPRLPQLSFYHVGHTVQLSHEYEQEIKSSENHEHYEHDDGKQIAKRRQQQQQLEDERLSSSSSSILDSSHKMNDRINGKHDASTDPDHSDNKNSTKKLPLALAYYHHYGNETLRYAGVPTGWSSMPYIWVPGAVESHHITHYVAFLQSLQRKQRQLQQQNGSTGDDHHKHVWIKHFVKQDDNDDRKKKHQNGNDDERPPNVDDDFWDNPPDEDVNDNAETETTAAASTSVEVAATS